MISDLSRKSGINEEDIKKVAALGVPTLVEALNRNANDERQAQSLAQALDDHADDNPYDSVGFLDRFLGGGEGGRMVEHIFPGNSSQVEQGLAEKTGLQSDTVKRILSFLAPLLLAHMASKWSKGRKQQQQQEQVNRQELERQQQNDGPFQRPAQEKQSPFDSPFGNRTEPEVDLPGDHKIQMPGTNRPQYRQDDLRDLTRQAQQETRERTDGSIFDIAKDVLGGAQGGGGILDDLLGGFFGKR